MLCCKVKQGGGFEGGGEWCLERLVGFRGLRSLLRAYLKRGADWVEVGKRFLGEGKKGSFFFFFQNG